MKRKSLFFIISISAMCLLGACGKKEMTLEEKIASLQKDKVIEKEEAEEISPDEIAVADNVGPSETVASDGSSMNTFDGGNVFHTGEMSAGGIPDTGTVERARISNISDLEKIIIGVLENRIENKGILEDKEDTPLMSLAITQEVIDTYKNFKAEDYGSIDSIEIKETAFGEDNTTFLSMVEISSSGNTNIVDFIVSGTFTEDGTQVASITFEKVIKK